MKKKILSAFIAGILVLTTVVPPIQVSATPTDQELTNVHDDYEKLQAKVNETNQKVQEFDNQISGLAIKINDNNSQIDNINKEVKNTNKEIDQAKVDISEKEDVLGKRLREVYKSGGQTSYLSLIFSADSFSDLISKIDTAGRLVSIDKKVVQDLTDNKKKLDEKVTSLGTKANEIEDLNEDIQEQKSKLDEKRSEQQVFVEQAKAEQDEFNKKFMTPMEQAIVQGDIDALNNAMNDPNSTSSSIMDIVTRLRLVRDKQLKSESVIKNVNDIIEKAKDVAARKKKNEEAARTNRGVVVGGVRQSGSTSAIVNYAYQFLGLAYIYGGTTPAGFDCSGFTQYVYSHAAGIDITRTTYTQINQGTPVSRDELQPGDLVFPHAGHVGIYIGNGQMIHSPQTGDVIKISPVYAFMAGRRILN
ncbi:MULTISPECIES: NlpC/P60 family protein [Clostridium]|uniref:C40 family peptidase n=1 Tax=Clostridium cibarium TaxID=2762247 RepID=A0ABR8PSH1_9CLOT|nr:MULTISPECIES: NlpC/P60 family protein [Clostridium]MBD7911132.1 C40 family peptidase [Clostridium cibarium]